MRDGLDYNSELEYVKELDQKPVPVPAEPVKYHAPSSLVANGICSEENFMTREQRNAAELVAGEAHLELCQCGHSRGLHTKAGACGVALCDCRKFAAFVVAAPAEGKPVNLTAKKFAELEGWKFGKANQATAFKFAESYAEAENYGEHNRILRAGRALGRAEGLEILEQNASDWQKNMDAANTANYRMQCSAIVDALKSAAEAIRALK